MSLTSKFLNLALLLLTSPILLATPIASEKLYSEPTNSMVSLSPSGKYIFTLEKKEGDRHLLLIELEKQKVVSSVYIGNDSKLNQYYWLEDQKLLLDMSIGGERKYLVGDIKNNKIAFTSLKADGYLVSLLPDRPGEILFAKRESYRSQYFDLYVAPLQAFIDDDLNKKQKINHNKKWIKRYQYNESYKRVLLTDYDKKKDELVIRHLPLEGGEWRTLIRLKDPDYHFKLMGLVGQDKIAVLTNKESDKVLLREFDLRAKKFGEIIYQHPEFDLVDASFKKNGELNFVEFFEAGLKKRFYFEKEKSKISKRFEKTFQSSEAYVLDDGENGLKLLYVNGSTQPGEYFIYDSNKDVLNRLLEEYSDLADLVFSQTEVFNLKTKDGTPIEAYLNRPQGIDLNTLLVMPHGGPIGVRDIDRFNRRVQYFTSRGFSVLRINFRGSAGFGEAFRNEGVGEFGKLIEEDIALAEDAVSKKYSFKKRCAIGGSYGGYSATMLAIKHPEKYQCVIAAFGVYDLPLAFNASNYRSGEEWEEIIGKTIGQYHDDLKKVSPVNLIEKLNTPILLVAGKKDDIADFEHSNRFKYLLKRKNKQFETLFYNNVGHGHRSLHGVTHELAATYDYILRTLGLPYPETKKLSKIGSEAISGDFMARAKEYYFGTYTEVDHKEALKTYKEAFKYNNPLAMYRLGEIYHYGHGVKEDNKQALKFYTQAAKLDHEMAVSTLGRMYMEGELIGQDWDKAKEYLEKALELNDRQKNKMRLARYFCTAPNGFRDVKKCISMMDPKELTKLKFSEKKEALKFIEENLVWTVLSTRLTPEERKIIKDFILKEYRLDDEKLELEDLRAGKFIVRKSEKFGEPDEYKLLEQGDVYQVSSDENEDEIKYGAIFDVNVFGVDRYSDQVGLFARWNRIDDKGRKVHRYNQMKYGNAHTIWRFFHDFKTVKKPEKWVLEIYSVDNDLLYQKEFSVIPEADNSGLNSSEQNTK